MSEITYAKAGVNIEQANRLIPSVKKLSDSTRIAGVLGGVGGFSALFDVKKLKCKDPVLSVTTDGVGTKLDVAMLQNRHDTVGIDLVAMCVNDLVTSGSRPITFLDYFALGKLKRDQYLSVLKGIAAGCRQAGCALVGGETAEMPGFYGEDQYDLAGFAVGVVERKNMIDGRRVKKGDAVIGLPSSGFHSNGFSLLRKVFSRDELSGRIGAKLLTPTVIYVKPVLELIRHFDVKSISHITGGGFYDNIPRVIPDHLGVLIEIRRWDIGDLFWIVQERSGIGLHEMFRTFNMGIGMVIVVPEKDVNGSIALLKRHKIDARHIGRVVSERGVHIL